ncbi:hypothetical protein [Micromonospora sp. NPDC049679]|uniref:hypothetical protein n=1 Tax=Micromonospora sp. NPDC049679 TaxID=3155920 RepID=UPI0033F88F30
MSYEVENRLTVALRGRADHEVDADTLLRGALTRGRMRQRHGRLGVAVVAAGLAGTIVAVLAAAPQTVWPGGRQSGPGGGLPADHGVLPALAAAPEAPAAADRADLVGVDPRILRFAVVEAPWPVSAATWGSLGGVESMLLYLSLPESSPGAGPRREVGIADAVAGEPGATRQSFVAIELAQGRVPEVAYAGISPGAELTGERQVRIGARSGTAQEWSERGYVQRVLRWNPVDGLEMRVTSTGVSTDELVALAESVRLDQATRCSAPVRVTALPPQARLLGCQSAWRWANGRALTTATLTVGRDGAAVGITIGSDPVPAASPTTEPTVLPSGTLPALDPSADPALTYGLEGHRVDVTVTGAYGHAEVGQVRAGLRRAGDPTDPSSWPTDPLR